MKNDIISHKEKSIGFIPSGWEVKKIKEIGDVSSGGTPDTGKVRYWNGDINWCTPTDISALKNKFLGNTKTKITEEGLKNSSAKILPPNSIIVCTRATIGKAAINTVPMSTNQGFKNIIPKSIDTDFLYYKIISEEHGLVRIASGSTFLEVSKTDFDNFHISIPPLPEQQKIAAILSTWDCAIDNCKAIIEELKIRNKGLAKQLLTGKMRVKGFESSKWETLKLGKLGNVISGLTYSPEDVNEKEGILVLRSSNIQDKKIDLKSTVYVKNSLFNPVLKDDILICVRNGSRNLIGKNLLIPKELEGVAFGAFMSVFRSEYNSYLIHLFDSEFYYREIEKNLGATINSINGSDLKKFKFPIPTFEEQKEIANILDNATEELNQYQQKLEALQLQKKGLMQQLLTGKVRVKITN